MARLCAVIVVALSFGASLAPASAYAGQLPAYCAGDPYALSAEQQSQCGDKTYALTSVQNQSDGWTRYTYATPNNPTWTVLPPAGFDPVTAPADELATYGIPPKPPATDPTGLSQWTAAVSRMSWVTPPARLVAIANATFGPPLSTSDDVWAGYLDYEPSSYFHYTYMQFVQPSELASRCDPNDAAGIWTGLGGWDNNDFGQDGTYMGAGLPLGQYQAWYETDLGPIYGINLFATPGWNFLLQTSYVNGSYRYNFYNSYTGQNAVYYVGDSRFYGDAADYIIERPTVNGNPTNLSNFGTLTVDDALITSSYQPIGNYPNYKLNMVNIADNYTLAATSALSSGDYFTVTQRSCN